MALYANKNLYGSKKKKRNYNKPKKDSGKKNVTEDHKLAEAVAIHTVVNNRTSTSVLENVTDLQNPDLEDRKKMISLSRKLRKAEGVCSSVADLLVDFAITKGSFYCDNDDLKSILNKWANFINAPVDVTKYKGIVFPVAGLRAFSKKVFDDYLVDGDAVFTVTWQKSVTMDQNTSDKPLFLPVTMKCIDTTILSMDDDVSSLGIERITLTLSNKIKSRILDPTTLADKYLQKSIPKEWLSFLRKGEDIILDPNITYHVKRNAKDYKAWGEPYFIKAFGAVASKRRLQAVDDATIDGLINRFTIFKIGLADQQKNPAYHIPSKARVQQLINILTNPKRANAAVWPGPDLDYIDIGPDGKILEFDEKYVQADKDILRALHVSPILIDGSSKENVSNDFISLLSTEVGLDYIRSELETIFTSIGKEIAIANNINYEQLYYKFDSQLLRNQENIKNFALKVYELGGVSVETFVNTMGYNFDAEKMLKEKEDSNGVRELFTNPAMPGITGIDPGNTDNKNVPVDEGGRPDKIDEEASEKANKISDNVTLYFAFYQKQFEKIKQDVKLKYNYLKDFDSIRMSLLSGFIGFRQLVNSQLLEIYKRETGGKITKRLQELYDWNNNYIDNFYKKMSESFDLEKIDIDNIFEKNEYRIYLYATESFRKATWVGKITKAELLGKTKGIWICNNSDSECMQNNGKEFTLDYLVSNFPDHPNCTCDVIFI